MRIMRAAGMTATVSSIHINGWFGAHNKWEGARWIVQQRFGRALEDEIDRWVYVGDSTNDQIMFQHFTHSVGVVNIARFVPQLAHLPRYVTPSERRAGFAELARHLLAARAQADAKGLRRGQPSAGASTTVAPRLFARIQAVSARAISASRSSPGCCWATPAVAVTRTLWGPMSMSRPPRVWRKRSITAPACCAEAPGSSTANSSPPTRARHVHTAKTADAQLADTAQHGIPTGVTVAVVHLFEVVQVKHHQRQRFARALRTRRLDREALGQGTPVGQAGQQVGGRLALQLDLQGHAARHFALQLTVGVLQLLAQPELLPLGFADAAQPIATTAGIASRKQVATLVAIIGCADHPVAEQKHPPHQTTPPARSASRGKG